MQSTYVSWNATNIITVNLMALIFALFLGALAMFYHQFFSQQSAS